MPRSPEIDRLRTASEQAFAIKQSAFDRMKPLGQHRSEIKARMDASWEEVSNARAEANSAYERQQSEWEAHRSERDAISAQIDAVARDADSAHKSMVDAFERSKDAWSYGDKAGAAFYSQEGKDHKYDRDSYNAEKARLISVAKSMTAPHSDFRTYKDRYDRLMDNHRSLQAQYQPVKAQHEAARAEFDRAKVQHEAAKAAFDKAIEEERAKWKDATCATCGTSIRINIEWSHPPKYCKACKDRFQSKREEQINTVNKAVMRSNSSEWGRFNGENARIKPRNDGSGKVDVYYGVLSTDGDGIGHGHVVIQEDSVIYLRGPWQDKKTQWDIDDRKDNHTKA